MDAVARLPALLLRLEGAAVLAGSLVLYFDQGYGWLALVVLALAPDLAALGYAAGPKAGAVAWLVHIGADRLLGYGLKYPTGFRDTHLQRV